MGEGTKPPPRLGAPIRIVAVAGLAILTGGALLGLTLVLGTGAAPQPGSASASGVPTASALLADVQPPRPPSPSGTASSAPLHRVGERLAIAGRAAHTVLRVEEWGAPSGSGRRGLAVRVEVEALRNQTSFDFQNYQVQDGAGGIFSAQSPGKQPALAYGDLRLGDKEVGWVTFAVPLEGPYVLSIRTSLGNGLDDITRVALEPIQPSSPDPTPAPRPKPTAPTTLANYGYPPTIDSTYFSGFGGALPGSSVSEVRGDWSEPKVTCSGTTARDAAFWVGIEDTTGHYLQQLGTLAVCDGTGPPTYNAWYEMFPVAPVPIDMAIHPGDRMTASVSVRGSTWRLSMTNRTTGATFTINKQRSAKAVIALWIAEAPSTSTSDVGNHVLPLADYGTVTFSRCSAVVDGSSRTLTDRSWAHFRFDMVTTNGAAKAVTSSASADGTSFRSSWRHS